MKKILKPLKIILILGAGIALARFVIFRDSIGIIPVRKVEAQKMVVTKTVSALGEIKSSNDANIAFTTSGTIGYIAVQKGDEIVKGQLIASLISPEGGYTIQGAKDARDIALRDKELFIENYKTDSDRDALGGETQYQIQLRTLEEAISRAEANYQSSLATYSRNYLYAPFEGRILDVYKTLGEVVTATEPVIKLAKTDLVFEISVDQADFGLLQEEQTAEITLDAYSGEKFTGKVKALPRYANGGANPTFTVEVLFEDPENKILLGMRGDAKITVASTSSEVFALLYDEVIFDSEEKPFVWVVKNGYLEKLPVKIGLEGDLYTEIKTDISNETLVGPFNNTVQLEQGYKAKIQE